MAKAKKPADIDGYVSQFPDDVRAVLQNVRKAIRRAAPEAEETISYQMPAFRQHGILVYFAAWAKHIGLYPPISGDAAIEKIGLADKLGDKRRPRVLIDLGRCAQLRHAAIGHDRDAIRHRQGFFLVVRDVDERGAELLVE